METTTDRQLKQIQLPTGLHKFLVDNLDKSIDAVKENYTREEFCNFLGAKHCIEHAATNYVVTDQVIQVQRFTMFVDDYFFICQLLSDYQYDAADSLSPDDLETYNNLLHYLSNM